MVYLFVGITSFEMVALTFYFREYPAQYEQYKGCSLVLVSLVQCFLNMARYGYEMIFRAVISATIMTYLHVGAYDTIYTFEPTHMPELATTRPPIESQNTTMQIAYAFISTCLVLSNLGWLYFFLPSNDEKQMLINTRRATLSWAEEIDVTEEDDAQTRKDGSVTDNATTTRQETLTSTADGSAGIELVEGKKLVTRQFSHPSNKSGELESSSDSELEIKQDEASYADYTDSFSQDSSTHVLGEQD